jgi:hypothetical protein
MNEPVPNKKKNSFEVRSSADYNRGLLASLGAAQEGCAERAFDKVTTMRIWLVAERQGGEAGNLERALRHAVEQESPGCLLEAQPLSTHFLSDLRSWNPDILTIHEPSWPDTAALRELPLSDLTVLVATNQDRAQRFQQWGLRCPLWYVPLDSCPDMLRLALCGLTASRRRESAWKQQLATLQQRLNDRIVIERAKGVLVQRLGISEEDAYKRLRVSSRQQRRQIRDIAQSLLDAQALLLPNGNGHVASYTPLEGDENLTSRP